MEQQNQKIVDINETHHVFLLKSLADNIATRFLCPLYLVGSFLEKGIDALDVDIIMVMTEDRMKRLFKETKIYNERQFRFCKKQKLYLEEHLHDVDIDFKVQSVERFKSIVGKRIKLDGWIDEY
jgi:hypothetical protein